MALPGLRGYGRDDNWAGGRNSGYVRTKTSNGDFGTGISPLDPSTGRRVDSLEQRVNKQENNHRSLLEQMMRLQQDFKVEMKNREQVHNEEKNQRTRMESALQAASVKLNDLDDRLRRVENSARENKNALSQLISHTKNVERAVTLNQQDIAAKKESQGTKLQELIHKVNQIQQNKETMDKTVYMIKDEVRDLDSKVETLQIEISDFEGALKLQSSMIEKINTTRHSRKEEKEGEQKMTETQRAMLEAKIMQCQQTALDLSAKLSTEKRERDQDMDQINSRLTDLTTDLQNRDRKREVEFREQEAKAREQMSLGSAEKQKIIMQISAVQTDIKRTLDERYLLSVQMERRPDSKIREVTVGKLKEMDEKMAEASRLRAQLERDLRTLIETEVSKQQLVADQGTDTVRKLLETETETSRSRIQEQNAYINQLESQISQMKSDLLDELSKVSHESEAKEKVLDAKIEDLSDKLRFGMATMQAAIGERSGAGNVNGTGEGEQTIPLQEIEMLQEEAIDGLREGLAKQIADLEEQIEEMKNDIRKQNEIVAVYPEKSREWLNQKIRRSDISLKKD